MQTNRSMPVGVLIPVLAYPSVGEAERWLGAAFGFELRWRIGEHRAQLAVGPESAVAITRGEPILGPDHVMVRVENAERHRARAQEAGATVGPVEEFPYGERQYTAQDHTGRTWLFSESVADVDPRDWGASV